MKKIRITQVKSVIDRSERQKRTMLALGLKKMNASVEVEATPQIQGMITKVNHLVKVEEISSGFFNRNTQPVYSSCEPRCFRGASLK
ncbi:MAG TPA: 50S ribosomal protein L30 [Chitinophagaceae bacterium]|nr:50S ribosomal protein L30 [Chitinophagaceae bacterium]